MIKSKKKKILVASVGLIGIAAVSIVIFSSLDKKAVAASNSSNQKIPQNQDTRIPVTDREYLPSTNQSQGNQTPVRPNQQAQDQTPSRSNTLQGLISSKLQGSRDNRILIIGDSQVGRTVTNAANNVFAPTFGAQIHSWFKEGTTPKKIMADHIQGNSDLGKQLKQALQAKFPVIFIQLGDNGISSSAECTELLSYINSMYPQGSEPLIIWNGPYPLCLPGGKSTSYVTAEPCDPSNFRCITNYQENKKNRFSGLIYQATSQFPNAKFLSPYHFAPFNTSNGSCFTSDGVHILQDAATSYLSNILGVVPS